MPRRVAALLAGGWQEGAHAGERTSRTREAGLTITYTRQAMCKDPPGQRNGGHLRQNTQAEE